MRLNCWLEIKKRSNSVVCCVKVSQIDENVLPGPANVVSCVRRHVYTLPLSTVYSMGQHVHLYRSRSRVWIFN